MRRLPWLCIVITLIFALPAFQASAGSNPYDSRYDDGAGSWRSNCTFWAWQRWLDVYGEELPRWGNAGEWSASAAAAGYPVTTTPAVGSIVTTWESPLGHVAFVEQVDPDDPNRFLISEYGYDAGIDYHERWLTTDGNLLFILPRDTASSVASDGDGTASTMPLSPDGTAFRIRSFDD